MAAKMPQKPAPGSWACKYYGTTNGKNYRHIIKSMGYGIVAWKSGEGMSKMG
jgi:hypothetical protein